MRREGEPRRESKAKKYSIDLSEAWDTESERELVADWIKQSAFNNGNYVFSGLDAMDARNAHVGVDGTVWCSTLEDLDNAAGFGASSRENAILYALDNDRGAIAVYEKSKLTPKVDSDLQSFTINDPGALVALLTFKRE